MKKHLSQWAKLPKKKQLPSGLHSITRISGKFKNSYRKFFGKKTKERSFSFLVKQFSSYREYGVLVMGSEVYKYIIFTSTTLMCPFIEAICNGVFSFLSNSSNKRDIFEIFLNI